MHLNESFCPFILRLRNDSIGGESDQGYLYVLNGFLFMKLIGLSEDQSFDFISPVLWEAELPQKVCVIRYCLPWVLHSCQKLVTFEFSFVSLNKDSLCKSNCFPHLRSWLYIADENMCITTKLTEFLWTFLCLFLSSLLLDCVFSECLSWCRPCIKA